MVFTSTIFSTYKDKHPKDMWLVNENTIGKKKIRSPKRIGALIVEFYFTSFYNKL